MEFDGEFPVLAGPYRLGAFKAGGFTKAGIMLVGIRHVDRLVVFADECALGCDCRGNRK